MKQIALIHICVLLAVNLWSQTSFSSDDLFKSARNAAFEDKNYEKAKQLSQLALQQSPGYTDIEIFLGRIFSWTKQYDSARFQFEKVLMTTPVNEEASIAFADMEYWNDNYAESLKICNRALFVYPTSEALLLRKAKILNATKKFEEANSVITHLLKINKQNTQALSLAATLKDAAARHKLSISYDHSYFDKQFNKAWHLQSISYGRQTSLGSITARLNYANRFSRNGLQGELDAYPRISKTFYSYINFGYSGTGGVFPKYRAGFSIYANLPNSFEAEAGFRYLYFSSATRVYTASIGKYYKSFLFSARTYITPSGESISQSYSIAGRYYFNTAESYFGISMGTGISPDDANQNIQFNPKEHLSSKQIAATFTYTFLKWNIISIGVGLINQEYETSVRGNQLNTSIGLSRRF